MTNSINAPFPVRTWNGKLFSSASEINAAAVKGLLLREERETEFGTWYTFKTLNGDFVCRQYLDGFGFSSQAYGVEIPNGIQF